MHIINDIDVQKCKTSEHLYHWFVDYVYWKWSYVLAVEGKKFKILYCNFHQISMNAPKDLITAYQALLPVQTLLDHTTVLVTLDLWEMERKAAL